MNEQSMKYVYMAYLVGKKEDLMKEREGLIGGMNSTKELINAGVLDQVEDLDEMLLFISSELLDEVELMEFNQ